MPNYLKFPSKEQNLLVEQGELVDNQSRQFIRTALNVNKRKVESKRHAILSGPPGVGKSYGTMEECDAAGIKYMMIKPGTSAPELAMRLAYNVYRLAPGEELVCILDDADDVMFSDYTQLNKWKIAMGEINYDLGIVPQYEHSVSMTNTIQTLKKAERHELVEAIEHYQSPDQLGISVPTDRVRFLVLCNLDLEDPRSFSRSAKLRSAIDPVLDRMKYKRINIGWEKQWGWLAFVLGNTQPFEKDGYELDDSQKVELLKWMFSNWTSLRSTSFRTVEDMCADMINYPDEYEDYWREYLRGN